VHRLYREWADVAPDEDDAEHEDDDGDAGEDEDEHEGRDLIGDAEEGDDDDDDISILPHDEVTKLSTVLKRSQKDTSHANATPESIAQSMEAMSISPYTG